MAPHATRVRLIALDVDGTLLDPTGALRPAVRDAVRRASALGIAIALVTGRRLSATLPVVRELGVPVAVLACQGALAIAPDGQVLWQDGIDLAAARAAVDLAREMGLHPFVYRRYRRRGGVVDELAYEGDVDPEMWHWFPPDDPCVRQVDDVLRPACRPLRVTVFAEPGAARRYREELPRRVPGRVAIFSTDDAFCGRLVVEVLPPRTHKGRALQRLARRLGIPRAQVLAIGDYHNDTEMIAWAGIGVAMANAPEAVQRVADWITASNGDDGVAFAIARFALTGSAGAAAAAG